MSTFGSVTASIKSEKYYFFTMTQVLGSVPIITSLMYIVATVSLAVQHYRIYQFKFTSVAYITPESSIATVPRNSKPRHQHRPHRNTGPPKPQPRRRSMW
ncbi:unnamed protein product [Bursaphelenchus okinawaensis]|uniref:Uncharacterized protein n=1 Tax=Bursaphelenchus okinawaensis TaxID=465554 RepID=A0A811JQY3_9BILA|nr:unnamed protein product [Bursaphelenchus okinawaensis]CAG9078061.1 unnamed protein product [Bursaphelenchus okinawaensis]